MNVPRDKASQPKTQGCHHTRLGGTPRQKPSSLRSHRVLRLTRHLWLELSTYASAVPRTPEPTGQNLPDCPDAAKWPREVSSSSTSNLVHHLLHGRPGRQCLTLLYILHFINFDSSCHRLSPNSHPIASTLIKVRGDSILYRQVSLPTLIKYSQLAPASTSVGQR